MRACRCVHECVCIHVCVHECVCMHMCAHESIWMHTCVYECVCMRECVYIFMCECVSVFVCMCVCISVCVFMHVYHNSVYGDQKRQLLGVCFLLPPNGFYGFNSGRGRRPHLLSRSLALISLRDHWKVYIKKT